MKGNSEAGLIALHLRVLGALAGLLIAGSLGVATHLSEPTTFASGAGPAKIGAGGYESCAILSSGALRCWGYNVVGQVGDGTIVDRHTPVDVLTLSGGVSDIDAGDFHACAVVSGAAKCWGDNTYGELGDGTINERHAPANVSGLSAGVVDVSLGAEHSCALTTGGGVKCWGENSIGQVGDGSAQDRLSPVDVSGLSSGVVAISAGAYHTCAVTSAGAAKCWGDNAFGQLGNNSTSPRSTPVNVSGLTSGIVDISAGDYHTCALTSAGRVKCWGFNVLGQLGNGPAADSLVPVNVTGIDGGATILAAGDFHTCAVVSGALKCWGDNYYGQLGVVTTELCGGSSPCSTLPLTVTVLGVDVTSVAGATSHTCAIAQVIGYCWGDNTFGQLGDDTTTPRPAPAGVSGLSKGACPDFDGDSLCDSADLDDDNDGCGDAVEQQETLGSEVLGGRRNPLWFWDFYDTPTGESFLRNKSVTGSDIFAVVARFNSSDSGPGDFNRFDDPLSSPNPYVSGQDRANYHPAYDRGGVVGPDPWDLGAANGSISGTDILSVVGQFNHSCA